MQINRILVVIAVGAVADSIRTRIEARKAAELYLAAHKQFEKNEAAHKGTIEYLVHMLNEHDIEIDQFDLIALNFEVQ